MRPDFSLNNTTGTVHLLSIRAAYNSRGDALRDHERDSSPRKEVFSGWVFPEMVYC